MNIRPFARQDTTAVIELWTMCDLTRPWNNPLLDIERKLKVNPEWFVVGENEGEIMASAMFGYEGHRGWVNYLAVSPQHQGRGYAKQLMQFGEQLLESVGCPKLSLQIRSTNTHLIAFYEKLGYRVDEAVSMGKRLIVDEAAK